MKQKSHQFILDFFIVASVVAGFFVANAYAATAYTRASLAGTYTCWSFNANGRGGKCTNPPLVLNKNGAYTMSSERGTYAIKNDTVVLSKSKFRGAGKILEEGMQIQFSYMYKGSRQTMTFLRKTLAAASVVLELTIKYPSDNAMGWVNTVQLIPQGKKDPTYDAIAYNDTNDRKILKAYWKKGVPGGKVYDVYTGTGFGNEFVGTVDLKNAKGTVKRLVVIAKKETPPSKSAPAPHQIFSSPEKVLLQKNVGEASENGGGQTTPAPDKNLPQCNPSIPKYAQPACKE